MISGRFVHLIDSHQDEILDRVAQQIRRDPGMARTEAIIGNGLRQWNKELLECLGRCLAKGSTETPASQSRYVGRQRFEQGVPLDECLRDLCALKETLLDYVEEHTFNKDCMELYAEEELDRRVGRFFDLLIVNLARGYESAMRSVAAASA
jgi:hypothetical protein